MLSERRAVRPFGLAGGGPAAPGLNLIVRRDGHRINMGAKATTRLKVGLLGGVDYCQPSVGLIEMGTNRSPGLQLFTECMIANRVLQVFLRPAGSDCDDG